jgi:hypothetical protein
MVNFSYGLSVGVSLVCLVFALILVPQVQANTAYIEKIKEMRK